LSWLFLHIPRSRQDPKILGRDDAEIFRYLIAVGVPFSGHLLAQKRQDRRFEIGEGLVAAIVRDTLMHQTPEPLDWIQMRAVRGDEVSSGSLDRLWIMSRQDMTD
jgi:hypothetical protein